MLIRGYVGSESDGWFTFEDIYSAPPPHSPLVLHSFLQVSTGVTAVSVVQLAKLFRAASSLS